MKRRKRRKNSVNARKSTVENENKSESLVAISSTSKTTSVSKSTSTSNEIDDGVKTDVISMKSIKNLLLSHSALVTKIAQKLLEVDNWIQTGAEKLTLYRLLYIRKTLTEQKSVLDCLLQRSIESDNNSGRTSNRRMDLENTAKHLDNLLESYHQIRKTICQRRRQLAIVNRNNPKQIYKRKTRNVMHDVEQKDIPTPAPIQQPAATDQTVPDCVNPPATNTKGSSELIQPIDNPRQQVTSQLPSSNNLDAEPSCWITSGHEVIDLMDNSHTFYSGTSGYDLWDALDDSTATIPSGVLDKIDLWTF